MNKPRFKIAVAGAIETHDCSLDVLEKAKAVGRAIGKGGHFVITGSHHGFPQFSAIGAKEAKGEVIYFSPAAGLREHEAAYRLDSEHADIIVYTGFGHVGAQIFMTRSADAVILGCGKIDAIHEFTLALKEGKPVGVLRGVWEMDDVIKRLVGETPGSHQAVIFEDDPKTLVEKLIELIK